jgi:KTSC domain
MSDPADQLSARGPIAVSQSHVRFIIDALRAGERAILVSGQDPSSVRVPDEALAACVSASVRTLHIRHPLPSLFELKDMIASAAGIAVGLGIAPQAMARLLLTSVPPWQSVVLAIDDADTLSRQSLHYLAQLSNALAIEAPILQIVFAAGPALLEILRHPDFEAFRNRIVIFSEKNSEQEDDRMKSQRAQPRDLQVIAPRSVQLSPLSTAPRRPTGRVALRLTGTNMVDVVLAIGCLLLIGYAAILAYSDSQTQASALAVNTNALQEFAVAPQRSPPTPPDARETDKVITSLIDQATAALQAAHQAARARVNPNGSPSPQVETALAQALPPSESATAADRPETVGKTDQPILFPKLAPQLPAGPSQLIEAPRATPPEPTAPGRVAALQRPIEPPPASGSPAAPSAPPEKPSPGLVQAEAGIACPPRDTFENAQRWVHERLKCERHPTPNGLWIEWAEYCPSGPLGYFVLKVKTGQPKVYLFENIPPTVWEGFKAAPSADKFYHSEIKGKRHWFRLASKLKPSAPVLTCHR